MVDWSLLIDVRNKERSKRYLKKNETNKHMLRGKTKASQKIWWILHKCILSKLQKCEHLHNILGQHCVVRIL